MTVPAPASSRRAVSIRSWWLHWALRTVLAMLALLVLAFAGDRYTAFTADTSRLTEDRLAVCAGCLGGCIHRVRFPD